MQHRSNNLENNRPGPFIVEMSLHDRNIRILNVNPSLMKLKGERRKAQRRHHFTVSQVQHHLRTRMRRRHRTPLTHGPLVEASTIEVHDSHMVTHKRWLLICQLDRRLQQQQQQQQHVLLYLSVSSTSSFVSSPIKPRHADRERVSEGGREEREFFSTFVHWLSYRFLQWINGVPALRSNVAAAVLWLMRRESTLLGGNARRRPR